MFPNEKLTTGTILCAKREPKNGFILRENIGEMWKKIKWEGGFLDSNNLSIGNHFFKVLVQIHYSLSPVRPPKNIILKRNIFLL